MGAYDDIIHLPHHQSKTHPQMSLYDRAAQFSPFRALTGFEDAIDESARLTDSRAARSEEEFALLNLQLTHLQERIAAHPTVTVTYFRPDPYKGGGAYIERSGVLRAIDPIARTLVFRDRSCVALDDIYAIREEV